MSGVIHRLIRLGDSKEGLAGYMSTSPRVKCQLKFYAKVLKWLPERYGVHVTAEKIKHSYGILIPVLWEEAYKKGLLKNGDALDLVSNRSSRNN